MTKKQEYDQQLYNKRWAEKNKEKRRYLSYKSTAKTFINKYAIKEDLKELEKLIEEKSKEFQ